MGLETVLNIVEPIQRRRALRACFMISRLYAGSSEQVVKNRGVKGPRGENE